MASVTKRIQEIKQPRCGFLRANYFATKQYEDGRKLYCSEVINAGLVGIAVDYMCRFMITGNKNTAFHISMKGAEILNSYKNGEIFVAKELLERVNGLDDDSIKAACMLAGYDVCYRGDINDFKSVESIVADEYTVSNIRVMIERGVAFLTDNGPVTAVGFTFEGAYTDLINSGDGDYLTKDGMWDLKTSGNRITSKDTLQLLIYYLMGKRSGQEQYNGIKTLGFFNPRKNMSFWTDVSFIPQSTTDIVSREVIGYSI